MEIITPITIDMQRTARMPEIYAKQGDACTRKVQINLHNGGIAWRPGKSNAVIRFCKSDGTGGIYDKLPDGTKAYAYPTTSLNDIITITLAPEVLTCAGDVLVDVAFSDAAAVLATFSFVVHVQKSPASGIAPSNNYYNYQLLADINQAIDEAKAAAAGAVKSVNGTKPDATGNVIVQNGVTLVNNKNGAVTLPINAYASCSTVSSAPSKAVAAIDGFAPVDGAVLAVKFLHNNAATSPRINYHGVEHPIIDRITNNPIAPGDITAGLYRFMLMGNAWILLDKLQGVGTAVPGDPGEDGGYWIPAVDADGVISWTASKDGMGDAPVPANIKGLAGANGGYYTPAVAQPETGKMRIAFNPSKDGMPTVAPMIINLPTAPAESAKIPVYACSSSADTTEKVIQGIAELPTEPGAVFAVQFANANTAAPSGLALLYGSGAYPLRLRIALPWQSQALLPQHIAAGMHYFAVANEDWVYLLNPYINVDALSLAVERGLADA